LEQLATDYENRLRSALAWSRAVVVITEIGGRTPAMQLRNIVELLLQWIFAQTLAVDEAAHVPELAEIAAALVGRIAAPQQFAGELVIEADHIGLDERLVGFDQRNAVRRDQADVRQEELDRDVLERLVHRQVDLRIGHHLVEVVADLLANPRRDADERQTAAGNRQSWIEAGDQHARHPGEIERYW